MSNKTQIRGNTQIKDLSINNSQIASNAGIETSKLAEGAELLKRDGSVSMTGDLNANHHRVENLAQPVADQDAVRKIDLDSAVDVLTSEIGAEQLAREQADSVLDGRLDVAEADIVDLKADLEQEIADRFAGDMAEESRARAAEAIIEDNLADEILRATTAEGLLSGRLDDIEADDLPAIYSRLDVVESNTDQNTIDIAGEVARATAAEGVLQDNIDAEEVARIAGDENLQAQIDALESGTGDDLSALEGRMDVAEADIDALESGLAQEILDRQAGVQEAKDYADQKIEDLVNGAPAVLDTLKELADALGNDENFATTVAGQIAGLDTRLDTAEGDIDDLEAADVVIDGRLDALEAADVALDGRLDLVEAKNLEQDGRLDDLETDLAAEEAARIAAVEDLQDQLDEATAGIFISREVPTGLVDGVNVTFVLANVPNPNSEQVFLNGVLQNVGIGNDYTISGATITFDVAPELSSVLLVNYISDAIIVQTGSGGGGAGSPGAIEVYQDEEFIWASSSSPTVRQITHNKGRVPDEVQVFYQYDVDTWLLASDFYQSGGQNWGVLKASSGSTNNMQEVLLFREVSTAIANIPCRIRLYWYGSDDITTQSAGAFSVGGTDLTDVQSDIEALDDRVSALEDVVINNFNSVLSPASGVLSVDVSAGSIVLGDLDAAVSSFAFTNVPAGNGKLASVSLIIDGDVAHTYGDACSVNGVAVSGGIIWAGGSAPEATDGFDMLTFAIVRDNAGTIKVFGSGMMNFS